MLYTVSPIQRIFASTILAAVIIFSLSGCKTASVPPASYLLTGNVHQQCLTILREGVQGDEFWPSIHAAEALIREDYAFEATPLIEARMGSERDRRRIAGYARALALTDYNQGIVALQDILLSDDLEARILAAEAMFRTGLVGDPVILEQATDPSNNGRLRVFAAAALTVTDRANMRDLVREALGSNDPAARYIAADVIPIIGSLEEDVPTLIDKKDLVNSDFENLYFVRALAMFGLESARKELLSFLKHPDPTIRSRAAFSIAEAWYVESSNQLIPLLKDPALAVRVRAAQALLTMANPNSAYRLLRSR
ncbi:MAG: HEAT repeat domain-containing protein [Bacteroidota bacterium]